MRHYTLKIFVFTALLFVAAAPGFVSANSVSTKAVAATYHTVAANSTNQHTLSFNEHHRVHLRAKGDGNSDIDLYVYDHHGNLIAKDDDHTDNCVCTFTPEEGENYYVKVVNRGHHANTYNLFYQMA